MTILVMLFLAYLTISMFPHWFCLISGAMALLMFYGGMK